MITLADIFAQIKVPACVIGGVAVAVTDPDRRTKDLDLVIAPSRTAARGALAALEVVVERFSCASTKPVLATPAQIAAGVEITVHTSLGTIEIVGSSLPEAVDRRRLVSRRELRRVGEQSVEVASLNDLIVLKSLVGRQVDLADVAQLRGIIA